MYYTVILLRSALHDCNNMPGLYHTNTGVVVLIKNSVWEKKLSAKMTGLFKCSQNYFDMFHVTMGPNLACGMSIWHLSSTDNHYKTLRISGEKSRN